MESEKEKEKEKAEYKAFMKKLSAPQVSLTTEQMEKLTGQKGEIYPGHVGSLEETSDSVYRVQVEKHLKKIDRRLNDQDERLDRLVDAREAPLQTDKMSEIPPGMYMGGGGRKRRKSKKRRTKKRKSRTRRRRR